MCSTEALKTIVGAALAGVSVLSLCEKGDAFIMTETGKIFKREKDMKKGQCFSRTSLLAGIVSDSAPPHSPSFCLQVSLFPLACQLTTVYAITPLWRVTLTSYWKTGTLSKCKLPALNLPCVLIHFLFPGQADFTSCFTLPCLLAVIWGFMLMASSQTWPTAWLSEWPRYVVAAGMNFCSTVGLIPSFTACHTSFHLWQSYLSLFRTTHRLGGRLMLSKQLTSVLRLLCVWLSQGTR